MLARVRSRSRHCALASRSLLVLGHYVVECLLVEVPARFVLRRFVDWLGAARRVGHHQILLVARPRDLRLHLQTAAVYLVLLLAKSQHNLINNFVRRIARLPTTLVKI